ncbi:TPA: 1-acyl-sn-glycerol-3-phosphate acyltransferase [Candidatus Poribacteria bacterium]|nr:1-acyl-sn-glycerol-3-phosphate acyltransferase [Candidatus Poribacteria bacterium]
MNDRNMRLHYHFCHVITRPLFKSLFKFQVFGAKNVPKTGGAILMMNHASYLDPIFIGAAVDRNLFYMARSTLFKPGFVDKFLRSFNAFPVQLGAPDRGAIKKALQILEQGNLLLIFPEGTRSVDGTLGKAQDGVGFIAYRTKAEVIPVFIDGTQKALPRGAKMLKTAKITVSFGKPINMDVYRSCEPSREIYSKIGEEVMARIGELKRERQSRKN